VPGVGGVDPRVLDEVAAAALPAAVEEEVAGWRCRADPSVPFRRANVALPPLGVGADPAAAVAVAGAGAVAAWYHRRGQRAIVVVSSADPTADDLDRALAERGWAVEAPVEVLVAPLARLVGRSDLVSLSVGVDEGWAQGDGALVGGDDRTARRTAAYARMLAPLGHRALAASARLDGVVVGVGFGVLDRGWLGIFGMATSPEHRRRGVAGAVVRALAAAAVDRGGERAYLQVEVGNDPALACYRSLGFGPGHGYHYRVDAPAGPVA
jgi:ribosomal protein S18 acetylase RimI-like enzyme